MYVSNYFHCRVLNSHCPPNRYSSQQYQAEEDFESSTKKACSIVTYLEYVPHLHQFQIYVALHTSGKRSRLNDCVPRSFSRLSQASVVDSNHDQAQKGSDDQKVQEASFMSPKRSNQVPQHHGNLILLPGHSGHPPAVNTLPAMNYSFLSPIVNVESSFFFLFLTSLFAADPSKSSSHSILLRPLINFIPFPLCHLSVSHQLTCCRLSRHYLNNLQFLHLRPTARHRSHRL